VLLLYGRNPSIYIVRLSDNEEQQKLQNAIEELKMDWPEEKFISKDVYPHFRQFTRIVLQGKEQKRRTVLQKIGGPPQQGRPPERRSTQPGEQISQPLRRSVRLA
jgi:hypothetical protein